MSEDLIKAVAPVSSTSFEGRTGIDQQESSKKRADEVEETTKAREVPVERSQAPPTQNKGSTGPPERPSKEDVLNTISERLAEAQEQGYLRELRFHYESLENGVFQLKVMDAKTDKVLRTIPHEEQIEFAERLDYFLGLLIDEQA